MKKVFLISLLILVFAMPAGVYGLDLGVGEGGLLQNTAEQAGYDPETGETTFAEQIGGVVQLAMSFLGVIFTALIVYGGFTWMLARGEEEKVKKAQSIIRGSIIGLVIVLASYSISYFITQAMLSR